MLQHKGAEMHRNGTHWKAPLEEIQAKGCVLFKKKKAVHDPALLLRSDILWSLLQHLSTMLQAQSRSRENSL